MILFFVFFFPAVTIVQEWIYFVEDFHRYEDLQGRLFAMDGDRLNYVFEQRNLKQCEKQIQELNVYLSKSKKNILLLKRLLSFWMIFFVYKHAILMLYLKAVLRFFINV
jgi:hypothetical protein